jgi:hypothetical protein
MPKKAKGKKGKKAAPEGPQPVTTVQIIQDRTKMLCPRMGDVYTQALNVEGILEVGWFLRMLNRLVSWS